MLSFLLEVLFVQAIVGAHLRNDKFCHYKICTKIDPHELNVHLVPHSHDDVGWLKTVDQYYNGDADHIQRAGVRRIINSVIGALEENRERRYVQVETAFFHRWWKEQDDVARKIVRKLVNSGRLEIVNGAWSMNDEAAAHYQSIIDQFTLGLKTINDTLGECGRPKIGWQLDPFGHSKEMASIYSQMGYDGLFFSRLDWRDKNARLASKTAEMIWQGDRNLGDNSNLFTSILYNHYSAPPQFCFDTLCWDTMIVDRQLDPRYNHELKTEEFADFVKEQARHYVTNNIIITMGDDFNYQDAGTNYEMMDKLVSGFELFPQYYNGKRINVFYSTPSCYLKAVNEQATKADLPFPLKTDDFFPYSSDSNTYWTGYFTSRPTSKRYERQGNNILQITKQLNTFVKQPQGTIPELRNLQEAMGIMQHHDAITGTEKQHVANDYHKILSSAIQASIHKNDGILSKLLSSNLPPKKTLKMESCLLSNISVCPISQSNEFIAIVYNPLSRPVSHYVRLPIESSTIHIEGPRGEKIRSQVLPAIDDFKHAARLEPAPLELVFLAEDIPALGAKSFKIKIDRKGENLKPVGKENRYKFGDNINGLELNSKSGLLKRITLNGTTLEVQQQLMYYMGAGNDYTRASGAYIFRPSANSREARSFDDSIKVTSYSGEIVEEIHQTFSSWAKQIIRFYRNSNYVEFDWLVGPIPVGDMHGKEVISRFTTKLNTGDEFYTDANGRQMVRRKRNYRETYQYTNEEPISGNYYPVTSKIRLNDSKNDMQFAVVTDRAQGGSSLKSGQVELMVHRRLLFDDDFGVSEALNEVQYGVGLVARGQHVVTFGNRKTSSAIQKNIAQQKVLTPWIFLSQHVKFWDKIEKEFSGLTRPLPENIQILTLEPWRGSDETLLLRLEHVFEINEDPALSKNVSIKLDGLFTYFTVASIKEMTLAANQLLDENERLQWIIGSNLNNFSPNDPGRKFNYVKPVLKDNIINLSPMQIRTFLLTVRYK